MKFGKRMLSLILALILIVGLVGCKAKTEPASKDDGKQITDEKDTEKETETETISPLRQKEKRIIKIGSWWTKFYDSSHNAVEDDPEYTGALSAQMQFDVVSKIEEKYNVEFYWENLTFNGVRESINTSVLAGSPDCDVYLVNLSFGIPAAINGLATDLRDVLPADSDLFNDQKVATFLDLGDGKAHLLKPVRAEFVLEATYPLGFNVQMLKNHNLEDPRELYKRGEWTWDKFIEYGKALTKDTNGDGMIDQYGYAGYVYDTFEQLLLSNGATIATGKTETLTSAATGEVIQMFHDIYNVYNIAFPHDPESATTDVSRFQYREGNIGFWPSAAWIAGSKADYDFTGANGVTLEFDTAYVQWPVGYSGNKETNRGKVSAGEYYLIPAGVDNPELIYNVMYDLWNWYEGDTSIRDDEETMNWWYVVTAKDYELQNQNYDVMYDLGSREVFELWYNLGFFYDFDSLLDGTLTPAQFQETYKQQVQDALDSYFK